MRHLMACCMALGLLANRTSGQEVPEFTRERQKLFTELALDCVEGGGFVLVDSPDGKGKYFRIADRAKMKATLAARKDRLTPDLRDAILATWFKVNEGNQATVVALLEVFGEMKEDPQALGLAAFLQARGLERSLQWKEAGVAYLAATKHFEAARQPLWQATSLNNLGFAHRSRGAYEEALDCYQQALEIRRKLYPPERFPDGHPHLTNSLNNLSIVHGYRGSYKEALGFCKQALEMDRKLYPPERYKDGHPLLAGSLNILGFVHDSRGAYEEALGYFQQALEMRRRLLPPDRHKDGHPDLAQSLNNLGGVHQSRGSYEEALLYHKQTLEMNRKLYPLQRYKDGHPNIATSLNNLGAAYKSRGSYEEALDYYTQALEMRRKLYPPQRYKNGHPHLALSLNNLGSVHDAREAYEEALRYHKQALEMNRKLYPPQRYKDGHPLLATSLTNLGSVYKARGSYEEAQKSYEEAAQTLRTSTDPGPLNWDAPPEGTARTFRPLPMTALVLFHRAQVLLETLPDRPSAAELRRCEQGFALAAAVQDRLRGEVLQRDHDRLHHGEQADDLLHSRLGLLARLFKTEGNPADLEAAFRVLERGRARLFLETLGEAHAATLAGLPDALYKEERRLSLRLRELDARIERLQGQPGDEPARLVRQLYADRLKSEEEELAFREKLRQSHPHYAGFRNPSPCTLQQARDCLKDNEVALLFTVGHGASGVLLLEKKARPEDKGQGLALFPLAGAKELDPLLDTLLAPQTLQRPALARPVADTLGRKVLGPLMERIAGKDLLIVADGGLGLFPFEMLREGGQWLVERHKVRYAPSLSAQHLSRQIKREPTPTPLWALADPIFDRGDKRAQGLSVPKVDPRLAVLPSGRARLLASGPEVEAICEVLGVPTKGMLRDDDAREAQVKEASRSGDSAKARFVHFATHGELGKDTTPQPRLVLGQVGNDEKDELGGPNDGFLTLPEVTFLKLNAQAVVLSACETGKGRRDRGEGVSGLARAFLYAGGKGVVCSLWSVDDARTAELMADFYKGLKDDKSTGEALRAARLKMIHSGRAPFFWAPFILMGE